MNTATFGSDKDGRILISGLLRITDGTLFDGFSKGLGSQDGGSYLQEGGTVTCWQFRPRSVAGNPPFSFTQTGGVLNVGYGYGPSGGKIDIYEEDYARFDLRSSNSTFQMSGNAVLNVACMNSQIIQYNKTVGLQLSVLRGCAFFVDIKIVERSGRVNIPRIRFRR